MRLRIGLAALVAVIGTALVFAVASSGQDPDDAVAFAAKLTGAKEKPSAGDKDGIGSFTAVTTTKGLCYAIVVDGIKKPTMAHIHKGSKSVAGPISITLKTPKTGSNGTVSGCISGSANEDAITALLGNPKGYYVNVHTSDFPNGAIRGQLVTVK